jgi:hypothetical protein
VTPVATSQIEVVVPVTNEYVLSLSLVRNPSERPSGEKNGWSALGAGERSDLEAVELPREQPDDPVRR